MANQPWVSSIKEVHNNGVTTWDVYATDEAAAESTLLKLVLADGQVSVADFGRKRQNLEDAFLALVQGDTK